MNTCLTDEHKRRSFPLKDVYHKIIGGEGGGGGGALSVMYADKH